MHIFLTGASGFVGTAVARDLTEAGYKVTGLVRSEEGAKRAENAGAKPHLGTLDDIDSFIDAAATADGIIHCGFNHDFSRFAESCATDKHVIDALASTIMGTQKPLIVTSGIALSNLERPLREDDVIDASNSSSPRLSEFAARQAVEKGANVQIMRLPNSVHGRGDQGFVSILINIARQKGFSAYVESGTNSWTASARSDVASAYRLALEKGKAGGAYHPVAEGGIAFKTIVEAIGAGLDLPVRSIEAAAVEEHFGSFAHFAMINAQAESEKTRAELGWSPKHESLAEDLAAGHYFKR